MPDSPVDRFNVLEMIARNEPLETTLRLLLQNLMGQLRSDAGVILLYRDEAMAPAAAAGVEPETLELLCRLRTNGSLHPVAAGFETRSLVSGATEVLGVLACRRNPSSIEKPKWEKIMASHQAMAGLAIEHSNLIEELTWKAGHDALTHVGNRTAFEDYLHEALNRTRTTRTRAGLISINLDRFSLFNEVLGNEVGDAVLRKAARRFSQVLPTPSVLTRTGGDEFQVILPVVAELEEAVACAQQLADSLSATFLIGDHELAITASFGVAVSSGSRQTAKDLEADGHAAARHAKRHGGNRVVAFDPSMATSSPELLNIEQSLRAAIRNDQLLIHYQPQINLTTRRLVGAEALLRWSHPKLGLVSPASFIAVAEKAGIIGNLADWLITRAIRQHQDWIAAGLEPLRLAINISPLQFAAADFADRFLQKIRDLSMDPVWLDLEITETSLMEDMPLARRHIDRLRQEGISFSLDDFGTGHSSLAYLRELPVQALKIDREFITSIVSASERPALVESVLSLGRGLHVRTIAEGIETPEQARALLEMGCDEAQGFLYSRPVAGADLLQWALARQSAP